MTQANIQEEIWSNIHYKQFYLAEEAPICNGKLRGEFCYNAISPTAWEILAGTYDYSEDFDRTTKELCKECTIIRQTIPKDSIDTKITKENHHEHRRRAKEETSSSYSRLHFGHYMAGALSDYINHFHALKATLLLHHGLVLECWAQGMLVMLQKMLGCSLITKLRSILRMEADFNGANKQIYGIRMLSNTQKYNLMPEENYSKCNRMADDRTLTKVLTYGIIWQTQCSAGIASVDANNCYNRIAHTLHPWFSRPLVCH